MTQLEPPPSRTLVHPPTSIVAGSVPPASHAPALCRPTLAELPAFGFILAQVLLYATVLRSLDLQTFAFRRMMYIGLAGFVIHHFLPARFRVTFFCLLTIGTMLVIFGRGPETSTTPLGRIVGSVPLALARTGCIVAIGMVLISIARSSLSYWTRAAILVLVGIIAAFCRVNYINCGPLAIIWPVLASFFMFRVIVFLYDATPTNRPPLAQSFAYFFLLPNICTLLFPIIDFKKFCANYYNEPALTIYQRGASWMGRGIVQLVLHRLVEQLFLLRVADVASGTDLVQSIVSTAFMYLEVSGTFHLVVGLLLLFGFNLPETNNRYFLASSFNDYWRRVNIYWKDFVMKVFYYPAFFKLKSKGMTFALVIATIWTFVVTWALHVYQTWWIKGSATFSAADALFWSILGLLVLVNSLVELKFGRSRILPAGTLSNREITKVMLQTAATFCVISILWSLWSSPTVAGWLGIWVYADRYTALWGIAVFGIVAVAKLVVEIVPTKLAGRFWSEGSTVSVFHWSSTARGVIPALVILVLAQPNAWSGVNAWRVRDLYNVLIAGESRTNELASDNQGYYEQLSCPDHANKQLWETFMSKKIRPAYLGADPTNRTKDFRFSIPLPCWNGWAYESEFSTNRWGMRDQEYDVNKSPHIWRIAMLGSSQVMGWGVEKQKVFEVLLENKLNARSASIPDSSARRYEVLNFAFRGQSSLAQTIIIPESVQQFSPDVIVYVAHSFDFGWARRDLIRALKERVPIIHPELLDILERAHVQRLTPEDVAINNLSKFEPEVASWSYRRIAYLSQECGAIPIAVLLPVPKDKIDVELQDNWSNQIALLQDAGFYVIDLSTMFDHIAEEDIWLSRDDPHYNDHAHAMIAETLCDTLGAIRDNDRLRSIFTFSSVANQ